jgi:carboxyl-terminal processing protease
MSARVRIAIAGLVVGLLGGLWLGGHPGSLPGPLRDVFVDDQVDLNAEAVELIEDNYYREVPTRRLEDASIGGMVRTLRRRYRDRFSHYFDPATFEAFQRASSGHFSGIGLTVSEVTRGLRVASVIRESPASKAEVEPGDLIVAVNGHSIAGENAEVSTAQIKGPAGSKVRITVLRPSTGARRELSLEREELRIPLVRGELDRAGGAPVAYVALGGFPSGAHGELRAKIEKLYKRGAKGTVLDLRGNGGGLLTEAVLVSSLFQEKGTVVITEGRAQGRRVYRAVGDALPRHPMVVLVNRDTASAAEIVTAALKENDLATVVGTPTFGKGVFQEVIDLPNGGALDLTVGEYLTSDGTSIAKRGVLPDVRAAQPPKAGSDPALDRALAVLAAEIRSQ